MTPRRSERNSNQFHLEKDFTLKIPPKILLNQVREVLLFIQRTDEISPYPFTLKDCKDESMFPE